MTRITEVDGHSLYAPSRMARIIKCPGSVQLRLKLIEELGPGAQNAAAKEGTYMHSLMEEILAEDPLSHYSILENMSIGKELTADQCSLLTQCIDYLHGQVDLAKASYFVIEAKVGLPGDKIWGTLDFGVLIGNEIHIFDWKFGAHHVEVEENVQLMIYMDGFLWYLFEHSLIDHPPFGHYKLIMHIVQPKIKNFKSWSPNIDQILHLRADAIRAITASKQEPPLLNPGTEQCMWCEAAGICEPHRDYLTNKVSNEFEQFATGRTGVASVEDLAALYSKGDVMNHGLKSVKNYLYGKLLKGEVVPGYKLVQGKSRLAWNKDKLDGLLEFLTKRGLDLDDIYETVLKSPSAIMKLLPNREGFDEFVTQNFYPAMAQEESNKPAIEAPGSVQAAFADFADTEDE